ncbi:hypothetical protein [Adhaeribacter aquaticus]|uniref:hypothetical protein n=1 Tax=Adhaeribacter aquaticus TaxID=299567 RepID=UPI000429EE97|nr:hypothetical protein [Adhaeribacter aquaticus]
MAPPVYIIGFILIPVMLLIGLLGWRFLGSGKNEKPTLTKRSNYKGLKTFNYKFSDYIIPDAKIREVCPNGEGSPILKELVSEEGYVKSKTDSETAIDFGNLEEDFFPEIENSPNHDKVKNDAIPTGSNETALEPGVRHSITTDGAPEIEQAEGPAQSLFHNPLTAPAPTDNDKKNREAEIALKRRRRAELKNSTGSAKAGVGELFSPDSPVKVPPPKGGADR